MFVVGGLRYHVFTIDAVLSIACGAVLDTGLLVNGGGGGSGFGGAGGDGGSGLVNVRYRIA